MGLFQSTHPVITSELDVLFNPCISVEENSELSKIRDYQEVKDVMWSMHPLKSPSLDGFLGFFFMHYWDIVGDQVVAAVQSFFREGSLLAQMNNTFILGPVILTNSALLAYAISAIR